MNNDLISIVVPVYNVEKYLARCFDCLCNQTYKNIEIICIDDKSTDNSLVICEEISKKDCRIYIHKNEKNLGISSVRNIGIGIAKGRYIFFIDSDDFIDINTIQLLYNETQSGLVDIVSCGFCFYYGKDNIENGYMHNRKEEVYDLTQEEAFTQLLTQESNYRCVWAKLIKREIIHDLSFPEGNRYGEDMIFTSQLICKAERIRHLNKILYFYNQEGISLVRSGFNKEKLKEVNIVKDWIKLTQKKFPMLIEKANAYFYITIINLCLVTRRNKLKAECQELKMAVKESYNGILISKFLNLKMKLKASYILLFY